jgi:hypothetical protein
VTLSIDAWTSEGGKAFLGMVVHYTTSKWQVSEQLCGFSAIHGQHTGEHLAEVVWDTIVFYGLQNKASLDTYIIFELSSDTCESASGSRK